MSDQAALDHIVIAAPNLAELVDWFAQLTGVVAEPGGRHPTGRRTRSSRSPSAATAVANTSS